MPGRNAFPYLAAIDWTPVIVAALTLVGVIVNGFVALYVARLVRTPSKMSIGDQVEAAHHVALTNRMILRRVATVLGLKADDPEIRALLDESKDG